MSQVPHNQTASSPKIISPQARVELTDALNLVWTHIKEQLDYMDHLSNVLNTVQLELTQKLNRSPSPVNNAAENNPFEHYTSYGSIPSSVHEEDANENNKTTDDLSVFRSNPLNNTNNEKNNNNTNATTPSANANAATTSPIKASAPLNDADSNEKDQKSIHSTSKRALGDEEQGFKSSESLKNNSSTGRLKRKGNQGKSPYSSQILRPNCPENTNGFNGIAMSSPFRQYWDFCFSIFLIFGLLVFPISAGFQTSTLPNDFFSMIVTILFLLDLIIRALQRQEDGDNNLIPFRKSLFDTFVSVRFLLDVCAIVPWGSIFPGPTSNTLLGLQLLGMYRLNTIMSTNQIYESGFSAISKSLGLQMSTIKATKPFIVILLFMHMHSMIIFLLGWVNQYADSQWRDMPVDGTTGQQYAFSFWASVLNTFNSTPTPRPSAIADQVFQSVLCILGMLVYGLCIGGISENAMGETSSKSLYNERMQCVNEYLRNKHIPPELRNRIVQFFEFKYKRHFVDENAVFRMLNPTLRRTMAIEIKEKLLQKIPFLCRNVGDGFDKDFTACIVECLEDVYFTPGEMIIQEGEEGDCMYFIVEGNVEIWRGDKKVDTVGEGNFFGEIGIMFGIPRKASAISAEHTHLYKLSYDDFVLIIKAFPDIMDVIEQVCYERLEYIEAMG